MAIVPQTYFRSSGLGDLASTPDPIVWTPGAIKDLVNATDADMQTLRADVASAGSLSTKQLEAVLAMLGDWQAWKDSLNFLSYLWYGTVARTREYQAKIAAWRSTLLGQGALVTGPGPNLPKAGAAPDWLKWGVAGVAVLGGTYVLAQAIGVVRAAGLPRVKNPLRRRRRHRR